jgi:hypothetical protein
MPAGLLRVPARRSYPGTFRLSATITPLGTSPPYAFARYPRIPYPRHPI